MSTGSPNRLLIPAQRPASREVLVPIAPYFLRDPAQVPVESDPRILAFETDGFMEDFLAVAGGTRTLPKLLPWRDWSEPPEAMLDSTGAKTYPNAIARRPPEPWEIEPESPAGMDPDGVPSDPAGGHAWLRKLYLPLHERFNLVAFDVVCQAPGWPRLARGRVLGAGALIRRLVRATAEERWEDWVALDDKHGAWLRLLDDRMRPPTAPPAPRAHVQVDPAALPVADLDAGAQTALGALLGVAGPLPNVALTSQPLTLIPPDAGQAAQHCTLFGYLPVFSSAQELVTGRLSQQSVTLIAAALADQAKTTLTGLFAQAPALRARAAPFLRTLLYDTLLPSRPTAGELTNARDWINNPGIGGMSNPANIHDAVATGVDLVLRRALGMLWDEVSDTATADHDIAGNVPTGQTLWQASGASGQATHVDAFAALADEDPLDPGNQPADWLRQNAIQNSQRWDVLVRERLHRVVDHWLNTGAIPAPAQGNSSVLGQADLMALMLLAVLRLRGCRLALAAYLSPIVGLGDAGERLRALDPDGNPIATAAALGEEIEAVLELEQGRADPRTTPPWPGVSHAGLPASARLLGVHRAGVALADLYAGLDAGLGAAGGGGWASVAQPGGPGGRGDCGCRPRRRGPCDPAPGRGQSVRAAGAGPAGAAGVPVRRRRADPVRQPGRGPLHRRSRGPGPARGPYPGDGPAAALRRRPPLCGLVLGAGGRAHPLRARAGRLDPAQRGLCHRRPHGSAGRAARGHQDAGHPQALEGPAAPGKGQGAALRRGDRAGPFRHRPRGGDGGHPAGLGHWLHLQLRHPGDHHLRDGPVQHHLQYPDTDPGVRLDAAAQVLHPIPEEVVMSPRRSP